MTEDYTPRPTPNADTPLPNAPLPSGESGAEPLPPVDFDRSAAADDHDSTPVDDAAAAKDKAVDTAQAGKQAAADVAGTAADAAKDVAQETQAQAKDLLGKTRNELNDQAAAQQNSLVSTLRDLGDQFAAMADTDKNGAAVQLVTDARDRTRDAADWLDKRDPGEVLDELRELGRRRPGAFLLGSAVAGVLAGRLTRGVAAVHSDDTSDGPGVHRRDVP